MSSDDTQDSVSEWIAGMKRGDGRAVEALWQRYFDRICRLADRKLGGASRSVEDERDLASHALRAIWEGARAGRFKQLENRDDLWQLLAVITSRKAANVHRDQSTRRERLRTNSDFLPSPVMEFMEMVESPPTEALIDQIPMSCQDLLSRLDDEYRQIALMRLAGHSNAEIATHLECSIATVERRLKSIRAAWSEYNPSP